MTEKGVASSECVPLSSISALPLFPTRAVPETQKSSFLSPPLSPHISATNIQTSIRLEGDEIIVSGRKWWISGAGDPRNAVHLVIGKSDTSAGKHQQQSIVIVPANAKGVKLLRPMTVVRFLPSAPHLHSTLSLTLTFDGGFLFSVRVRPCP